jgi:galactokinase
MGEFEMIDYRELRRRCADIYDGEPRIFRAPGRVNLIGEHTDYNDGFVLPMAIDREATVAIVPSDDRKFRVHTLNFDESGEFDLDVPFSGERGRWINFIEGMVRILESKGKRMRGSDIVIWSDIPSGAGLSSSAALEIVIGLSTLTASGEEVDRTLLARAGQQTEHDYVGAKVGIMDQFVSANAREGHALRLDCRSLEFENVPLDTSEVAVVICDTNVKHDLATSAYNTRREECSEAVEILKTELPGITHLRDVSVADFEKYESLLPEPVRSRARHVVTENERTVNAAEALKRNDLAEFGRLMWESHRSLRDDYEVSSPELDTLVEIARGFDGVLGSRMTGGGFGGSTVSLVPRGSVDDFRATMAAGYQKAHGRELTALVSEPCAGASEVLD